MTLIRDIRRDINNPTIELSDVLRTAKTLARRLKDAEFEQWIDHELMGYDGVKDEDLPAYRKAITESYGDIVQPFGIARNVPLRFPEDSTKPAFTWPVTMYFREGVRELAAMTRTATGPGSFAQDWPQSIVDIYSSVRGIRLVRAYKVVTLAQVEFVLDSIRTRLLNFVLAIEQIDPRAGEETGSKGDIAPQTLQQILNVTMYGDGNIVAAGHSVQQIAEQKTVGARPDEIAQAFATILQRLDKLPPGDEKRDAASAVNALELEAHKGKDAQEKVVRKWLIFLFDTAPDMAEVAIDH